MTVPVKFMSLTLERQFEFSDLEAKHIKKYLLLLILEEWVSGRKNILIHPNIMPTKKSFLIKLTYCLYKYLYSLSFLSQTVWVYVKNLIILVELTSQHG